MSETYKIEEINSDEMKHADIDKFEFDEKNKHFFN